MEDAEHNKSDWYIYYSVQILNWSNCTAVVSQQIFFQAVVLVIQGKTHRIRGKGHNNYPH